MNINMEYYRIFYYVAKYSSITGAANKLCISQPAVSQAVKQLEEAIGASLFVRNSKGVRLTVEGQTLYRYVSSGYEQIMLGENKVKEMLDLERGEVRIGASDMTLQFYLLPYLEQFHLMYPGIKVSVTNAPTPLTIEHMKAGRIDFGVVSKPFGKLDRINIIKGREIEDVFVAGEAFKMLKGKTLSYSDLARYPYICLEQNTSTRQYVDAFLRENGYDSNPEFELATSSMVVQFASRNMGIGSVVKDFAEEELQKGTLFLLRFDREIPHRDICVITDNTAPMSKAAKTLIDLLQDDISKNYSQYK